MLNQVILVGRLVRTPELTLTESGRKKGIATLAVNRGFKNQNGEYDTDFLDCTLWTGIAENTAEYCKTGDIIGIKGRLQTRLIDNDDGTKHKKMEIIADNVTFLSSSRSGKSSNDMNDEDLEDSNNENDLDNKDEDISIDVVKESESKYNKRKKK